MPFVSATEKWICQRVGISHAETVDVTVLTLPGSYREKICELNRSLISFTSLRKLDLSNNALTNLDGLDRLTALETLNLPTVVYSISYNNSICDIRHIHTLKHNTSLQDLDFRLNPVTTNETCYRLLVVHLLPRLRVLDKRSVGKDRQAALQHFATDQASPTALAQLADDVAVTVAMPHQPPPPPSTSVRDPATRLVRSDQGAQTTASRRRLVESLASHPTALDEDITSLVDRVQQCGGDLTRPLARTGNVADHPTAVVEIPIQDRASPPSATLPEQPSTRLAAHRQCTEPEPPSATANTGINHQHGRRQLIRYNADNAAAPYHVTGHATLQPRHVPLPTTVSPDDQQDMVEHRPRTKTLNEAQTAGSGDAIDHLIASIRRLTPGSTRSIEGGKQLRAEVVSMLHSPDVWRTLVRERQQQQQHDSSKTRQQHFSSGGDAQQQVGTSYHGNQCDHHGNGAGDPASGQPPSDQQQQAAEEERPCRRCSRLQEQTVAMEKTVTLLKQDVLNMVASAETGERALADARTKIHKLKQKLKHSRSTMAESHAAHQQLPGLQQTIAALQECQSAVVSCNDRLLQENEDLREQHRVEMDELHWSYQRQLRVLKKTASASSAAERSTSPPSSSSATSGQH